MSEKKICGIYKITSPTGKIYIGQSIDFSRRLRKYMVLPTSLKVQPRVYNSLKKYTPENHTFEIIEECLEEDLNCRERFWQDHFNVLGEEGLNCLLTQCEEIKAVLSRKIYESTSKKVINIQTKEIYNSISHAARELNLGRRLLTAHIRKPVSNITIVMLLSDYSEDLDFSQDPIILQKRKVIRVEDKKIFNSVVEASKHSQFTYHVFGKKLRNKSNNDTGFLFLEDYLKGDLVKKTVNRWVKVINIDTGLVFDSIKKASEFYNINCSTLRGYLSPNSNRDNPTPLRYKKDIID